MAMIQILTLQSPLAPQTLTYSRNVTYIQYIAYGMMMQESYMGYYFLSYRSQWYTNIIIYDHMDIYTPNA